MNPVSAAKIQVVGLTPIKKKLGARWDRLSDLVHRLFVVALRRAQHPGDRIFRLDELSYAVSFAGMSLEETSLFCISVAKEVCEKLFGNEIEEISVRSLVAQVQQPLVSDERRAAKLVDSLLELHGLETIVKQTAHKKPVVTMAGQVLEPLLPPLDQIKFAHAKLQKHGRHLALFPVWKLKKRQCTTLFLVPFFMAADQSTIGGQRSLAGLDAAKIAEIDITILKAASAYALRVQDANQICAIGVGVGYETLSRLHTRVRYLAALQCIRAPHTAPLLVKIEQIPTGTPLARVAELTTMLKSQDARVSVEFQAIDAIPDVDVRLGAIGIGGAIPKGASYPTALMLAEKLERRAISQNAFAFLNQLDTTDTANAAVMANIRFGAGDALGIQKFCGLEPIPRFPLSNIVED